MRAEMEFLIAKKTISGEQLKKNVIDAKLPCDVLASLSVLLCHYLRNYIMPLGKTKSAVIFRPKQGAGWVKPGTSEILWARVNISW